MNRQLELKLKRALDLVGATVGLVLPLPLYLAIAAAIRATMGAPVIFRQQRPGYRGRPFTMYKFRTMRHVRPGEDPIHSDLDRLTALGAFLKKYSLDELPELLNVLAGDMSLVGPRPLLMEYLDKYTPEQRRRHDMKPGITGWAQINGRTSITLSKKFEFDVWYVDNWSLALDLQILFQTVAQVLWPEDTVVDQDHDTIDDLGFLSGSSRQSAAGEA